MNMQILFYLVPLNLSEVDFRKWILIPTTHDIGRYIKIKANQIHKIKAKFIVKALKRATQNKI